MPTSIMPVSSVISTKNGLTFYAVAIEHFVKGQLSHAEIVYFHATDRIDARIQCCIMHPNRNTHRIVEIAPVIGYFVEDNHGEILAV